jgi:4-hydroxy-tetrahydrodipicolinate synthase
MQLKGIIPPIITSFKPSGEIDEPAFRRVIDFLAEHVHGLFVCGSYGCGPLMTIDQQKRCVEIVIEQVGRRIPTIVHLGVASTDTAVELARFAEKSGAVAIASVPPYYYRFSDQEILRHFGALVDSVDIPTYVYNNPESVGYGVSTDLMLRLADLGVAGVKDTSYNIIQFADYVRKTRNFDVVLGTDTLFVPAWVMGARACISGSAIPFPELVLELYELCAAHEYDKAWDFQKNKLFPIRDVMKMAGSTVVACYELLRIRGIDPGMPKAPFHSVDEATRERMREALEKLELI